MSATTAVALTALLVLGNAFFVGAEFALLSARRTQIEPLAEEGSRVARTTLLAMENMPKVIAVNQLGIFGDGGRRIQSSSPHFRSLPWRTTVRSIFGTRSAR